MRLISLTLQGFKSFARKSEFNFNKPIIAIVGPNGSGKSNVVEAIRFVLGEQSMKSLRSGNNADLIFKGSTQVSQMNRASVTMVLDNHDGVFSVSDANSNLSLDTAEVSLMREVNRDGTSSYKINGVEVRLKDVLSLISSVNIGASGHHIISQGQSDRVLNASIKERKQILEDALGLKSFHYRIKDSERKLNKTESNLEVTKELRSELSPRLSFLRRQVEKIQKAKEMREELYRLYQPYIAKRYFLLRAEGNYLNSIIRINEQNKIEIELKRKELLDNVAIKKQSPLEAEKDKLRNSLEFLQNKKQEVMWSIGKIEGIIELSERQNERAKQQIKKGLVSITLRQGEDYINSINNAKKEIVNKDYDRAIVALDGIQASIRDLFKSENSNLGAIVINVDEHFEAKKLAEKELKEIEIQITDILNKIKDLNTKLSIENEKQRESERSVYEMASNLQKIENDLSQNKTMLVTLNSLRHALDDEISEGSLLCGHDLKKIIDNVDLNFAKYDSSEYHEQIQVLDQQHREIDRIKIRLEDLDVSGGNDLMDEHKEVMERDEYLLGQIEDLEKSIANLQSVIDELKEQLEGRFTEGLIKINEVFGEFFVKMFGGGGAQLISVKEEMEEEVIDDDKVAGIDIKVNLPRKKVERLDMLSGGERSLVSIALLFALSQVNPPPFLVLDETDAALDEANSRKYGDLLKALAEYSELVVVTHNRETMSRADVLYGVTLDAGGASKLLSVSLDGALFYAK